MKKFAEPWKSHILLRKVFKTIMARKSKRMALYEAIQQGQAKIAEGLKTGRLRSDAPAGQGPEQGKKPPVNVEMPPVRKTDYQRSSLKPKKRISVSPKAVLTGIGIIALIAVFAVGFWMGTGRSEKQGNAANQSLKAQNQDSNAGSGTERSGRVIGFRLGSKQQEDTEQDTETQNQTSGSGQPVAQPGDNVIVIASANEPLKGELVKVLNFFKEKGIETEIIQGNSGYVLLVTKQGFKKDPQKEGNAGYQLLQRIKQYGSQYPEETGDTQWGKTRAFQDAYTLKRD